MTYQRFSVGTQVRYNAVLYEVARYTPDNEQAVTLEDASGGMISRSLNTLVDALFSGELEFVIKTRINRNKQTSNIPNPEELKIDLSDYPSHMVETAHFRFKAILPLIQTDVIRTKTMYEKRVAEMKAEAKKSAQSISWRSLYRWVADYESGGGEIRCLIPNARRSGGAGKSRLPTELVNIIDRVIKTKLAREKCSVHDMLALVAAQIEKENLLRAANEQLKNPSQATIERRLDALDLKQYLEAKKGKRKAAQLIKQVGKTDYPDLPLERVEFDHTRTDLIVIDEKDNLPLGRCTVSFALDMATRYPLGYYLGFEPPSYYTVLECLYHSICPKPNVKELYGTENDWIAYGIPNTLVTDQGKELIGKDLSDACESLGILLDVAPIKTPEFKGGIERNFGTLNNGLFHQIPGTTFSNFLEKGDYNSEKQACVSLNELETSLNLFIVDEFSQRFHHGLGGIPARRWEYALETNFFPRLPPDRDTLRILLGRVDHRVIHKYGVEFETIRYNCPDLAYLRLKKAGEKVKIKYHPGDLSRIYVFNEFENAYIEVPALDQAYTENLSLWKHKVIQRFGRINGDKEDLAALGRSKLKIQNIVDAAKSRLKLTGRAKAGRWEKGGKPSSLTKRPAASKPKALPEPSDVKVVKNPPKDIEIPTVDTTAEGWEIVEGLPANRQI